jgi:hypothetical protein
MGISRNAAIADADVGLSCHKRRDNQGDVRAFILTVSVCVDDDVGAFCKTPLDPAPERFCKAAIAAMADDMVDAPAPCDACGVIAAPIVDNTKLNRIDPGQIAREFGEGGRQDRRLVQTWYLDDELGHACLFLPPANRLLPAAWVRDGVMEGFG